MANNVSTERAQDTKEPRLLEAGKPVERELVASEVHRYQITLASGQYLRLILKQESIDVAARLLGPDGKRLAEVDNPNGTEEPERISLITQSAGSFTLEIRPAKKDAAAGRYEARIEQLRAATESDQSNIAGEQVFLEAERLRVQGTAQSLRDSIKKYEEAIELYRAGADPKSEAEALNNVGAVHYFLSDNKKALDHYNQALPLFRAVGERKEEADTLNNIGNAYMNLGEYKTALDYLNQSLSLKQALGNRKGEANTLSNIGTVYNSSGEYPKALEFYGQSLELWRAIGDRAGEASTLRNMSVVYNTTGEYQKAIDCLSPALALARATANRSTEAGTLNSLGNNYYLLGEYQRAIETLNQALPIRQDIGDRRGEAATLSTIGVVYFLMGERQKASDFYNRAIQLHHAVGDRRGEAGALNVLSRIHSSMGDHQKALDLANQALTLTRAIGERAVEARVLTQIGWAHSALGDTEKALDYLKQSLRLASDTGDRRSQAFALYSIARVEGARGSLDEARSQNEAALRIIESIRNRVASQNLRTTFFASVRDYYELNVDLLMRLHKQRPSEGFDAAALQASERSRARSLLETLTEAGVDIREGVEARLLERERSLQQLLNAKADRQTRLLAGKHTDEQAVAAAKEIEALAAEYEQAQAEIRATSPRYAALTQPQPLTLKEIQQQAIDSDSLLLEYALGNERSYLWAVSQNSISSYELPGRAELEATARRFYQLIKSDSPIDQSAQTADELSRMLLVPAGAQLAKKRLLIVADGALQYVPFAALPAPQASPVVGHSSSAKQPIDNKPRANDKGQITNDNYRPLIVDHEILSLPSASTLALLRRETLGRKPATKIVAVLADPVFRSDDSRIKASAKEARPAASHARRDSASRGQLEAPTTIPSEPQTSDRDSQKAGESRIESGLRFARLIGSRREAASILALVPERERKQAFDFEASRATATSAELGQYRIVHFATHGLLDSTHPELSGVVLSLVDERGNPHDGFLRLNEIYNLKLSANLVVLSACQTALGKEVLGEGLVGLTRGFMYAGAPRVVASLWRVDDKATAELMKHFYQAMLGGQRLPAAAALRVAQIEMLKQKQWQAPYYWAAFGLQGDWR